MPLDKQHSVDPHELQGSSTEPMAANAMDSLSEADQPLYLKIVSDEAHTACRFWIGLAKPGSRTPSELLDEGSVSSIFSSVTKFGVTDPGPIMLTDSTEEPPRYIYLLPVPETPGAERDQWIDLLARTVGSWKPENLGFCFAPEVIPLSLAGEILKSLIIRLSADIKLKTIYLLMGSLGLSRLLNEALILKQQLEDEGLEIFVFH